MRRTRSIELMMLTTIVMWALNLTLARYILTHGFQPLAYASLRYGLAVLIFVVIVLATQRSLRIERGDLPLVLLGALMMFVNQISFVYALDLTSASTIGLLLGATPAIAALIGLALGLERLSRRFWTASLVSFAGVGLVALGTGGTVSASPVGILLGLSAAASWAAYSLCAAPLMQRYSASHVSAVVLGLAWIGIAAVSAPQTLEQELGLGWKVWTLFVFTTIGPLVLSTILWFRVLARIGVSRATLAANLHPFVAAVFAVLLLSERLTLLQAAGGVLIAGGILLARRRTVVPVAE
jgi:drug/metabolite transporter (DMT)-like permease